MVCGAVIVQTPTTGISGKTSFSVTATNLETSLTNGLVLWLTFDGNDLRWISGVTATNFDRSPSQLLGAMTAASRSNCVPGVLGQAYRFTGASLTVKSNAAINDLKFGAGMTLSFWVNPSMNSAGNNTGITSGAIIQKQGAANFGSWNIQLYNNTDAMDFQADETGGSFPDYWIRFPHALQQTNKWNHFVFQWDGGTNTTNVAMWCNGNYIYGRSKLASLGTAFTSDAANNLTAGLNGVALDDIRLWNRLLTTDEIALLGNVRTYMGNTGIVPSTNIINADLFLEMEGSNWQTNGTTVTTSLITNGLHDNLFPTWSMQAGGPPYVTNNMFPVWSHVRVNGTTYTNSGTHGVAFGFTNGAQWIRMNLPAAYTNIVAGFWFQPVDTADNGTLLDRAFMDPFTNSGYAVCSLKTDTSMIVAHSFKGASSFVQGPGVIYGFPNIYWINFGRWKTNASGNPTNSTVIVEVYRPDRYSTRTGRLEMIGRSEQEGNPDSSTNFYFGNFNDAQSSQSSAYANVYGKVIIGVGTNAVMPFGP